MGREQLPWEEQQLKVQGFQASVVLALEQQPPSVGKATWQGGEALALLEAGPLSSLGPDSEKCILGAPFSFLS